MRPGYQHCINHDPKACGDEPVITGIRATARAVLASLAECMPQKDILPGCPWLTLNARHAVIAFSR